MKKIMFFVVCAIITALPAPLLAADVVLPTKAGSNNGLGGDIRAVYILCTAADDSASLTPPTALHARLQLGTIDVELDMRQLGTHTVLRYGVAGMLYGFYGDDSLLLFKNKVEGSITVYDMPAGWKVAAHFYNDSYFIGTASSTTGIRVVLDNAWPEDFSPTAAIAIIGSWGMEFHNLPQIAASVDGRNGQRVFDFGVTDAIGIDPSKDGSDIVMYVTNTPSIGGLSEVRVFTLPLAASITPPLPPPRSRSNASHWEAYH